MGCRDDSGMNPEIPTEIGVILPESLEAICRFYTILLKCYGFVVVVALPETTTNIGVGQEIPDIITPI